METLTRQTAASQPAVRKVQLSDSMVAYVRRLSGEHLEAFVSAVQQPPSERAAHLVTLCVCNDTGAPMFPELNEAALSEVRNWPPVWLLKLSDEAGQINGLDLDGQDPNVEADAP